MALIKKDSLSLINALCQSSLRQSQCLTRHFNCDISPDICKLKQVGFFFMFSRSFSCKDYGFDVKCGESDLYVADKSDC